MNDSNIFGISVRAVIALLFALTACYMSIMGIQIMEPLYTLVVSVVSFLFGSNYGKQKVLDFTASQQTQLPPAFTANEVAAINKQQNEKDSTVSPPTTP